MHLCRKNEVKICEKVSNNLGQLSSTLPRKLYVDSLQPANIVNLVNSGVRTISACVHVVTRYLYGRHLHLQSLVSDLVNVQ